MKTRHDGDCTIYASLVNEDMPEAGICTCGFGHERKYSANINIGDPELIDLMYSKELQEKLKADLERTK